MMYAAADHREGSGRVIQSEISNLKSEILSLIWQDEPRWEF
jgi:hypothetical protein